MRAAKCHLTEAVSRAFPSPLDETLNSHVLGCSECQHEWQSLSELRSLALRLPVEQPDAERRDTVRARLLYQAERLRQHGLDPPHPDVRGPRARRVRAVGWALSVAAVLVLVLAVWRLRTDRADSSATLAAQRRSLPDATSQTVRPETSSALLPPANSTRTQSAVSALSQIEARVEPRGPAEYVRDSQGPREVVRLRHGSVQFHVRPLPPGSRFIVRVGDAEVEVKGTQFVVTAEHDRLQSVAVDHGLVEVRLVQQPSMLLSAGQTWQVRRAPAVNPPERGTDRPDAKSALPPTIGSDARTSRRTRSTLTGTIGATRTAVASADAAAPSPARDATQPAVSAPSPARDTTHAAAMSPGSRPVAGSAAAGRGAATGSPAEQAFLSGFSALKQGRFASAASDLDRAVALDPGGAISEDARFWLGVAWARSGHHREAMASLRAFLTQHPHSPRQPEVSAALAWMLIRDHKLDEAERVVRGARTQRSAEVAESLRTALSAIAAARAQP